MLPDGPLPVEGRVPTADEMELKASNGRYYISDIWVILNEFPSHPFYETKTDLENLGNTLYPQIRNIGYELEDASARMNDVQHCLELTMRWAELVHEARTQNKMLLIRRTPDNCGALLMQQRIEHLRGQCTEMAPVAYIVLVRDEQVVVTRDRVTDQATTERILIKLAKSPDHRVAAAPPDSDSIVAPIPTPTPTPTPVPALAPASADDGISLEAFLAQEDLSDQILRSKPQRPPNMPVALFKQQMRAVQDMLNSLDVNDSSEKVALEGEQPSLLEVDFPPTVTTN